jgi:amino-acid N-acetyltransferase
MRRHIANPGQRPPGRRKDTVGESMLASIRPATERDARAIRDLLEKDGLPTADLTSSQPELVVALEGDRIVGVGGLERFGTTALVRSLAVVLDRRGSGIGRAIVAHLEQRACDLGVSELVLLTETAKGFFERRGYRVIERQRAPAIVQASEEFRSLCPSSATCMSKTLIRETNG